MIPNLDEAGAMLQVYNKGDFHLLHGEVVAGITAYFARKSDPENEEYWAAVGMLHDIGRNEKSCGYTSYLGQASAAQHCLSIFWNPKERNGVLQLWSKAGQRSRSSVCDIMNIF